MVGGLNLIHEWWLVDTSRFLYIGFPATRWLSELTSAVLKNVGCIWSRQAMEMKQETRCTRPSRASLDVAALKNQRSQRSIHRGSRIKWTAKVIVAYCWGVGCLTRCCLRSWSIQKTFCKKCPWNKQLADGFDVEINRAALCVDGSTPFSNDLMAIYGYLILIYFDHQISPGLLTIFDSSPCLFFWGSRSWHPTTDPGSWLEEGHDWWMLLSLDVHPMCRRSCGKGTNRDWRACRMLSITESKQADWCLEVGSSKLDLHWKHWKLETVPEVLQQPCN